MPPPPPPVEMAAAAADAATWLADTWIGQKGAPGWSAFYAARFNEIITKSLAAPYWRTLNIEWDKTGIAYPEVLPFSGTVSPAYDDPLRQPTDCRFNAYSRTYATPDYPSFGTDKSPGWAGTVDAGHFKDTWHATRILAFTIPTGQQSTTRRPIILHISTAIRCTATLRGNMTWFAIGTRTSIESSSWSPGEYDKPQTHYRPAWRFHGTLPGTSPGGWLHDEVVEAWRYGSWGKLENQQNSGEIVLAEIGTPPSLGRYYAGNDSVVVLHDDTAAVWWPQQPGEM